MYVIFSREIALLIFLRSRLYYFKINYQRKYLEKNELVKAVHHKNYS